MPLQSGAQLILQVERPDGLFECEGFLGLPVLHPVFLALACAGTAPAQRDLQNLRQALMRELKTLAPAARSVVVPCGGKGRPSFCHAVAEADCQKVLVCVGDVAQPLPPFPELVDWAQRGPEFRVLLVFPESAKGSVKRLIPHSLRNLNVEFWTSSVAEVLPAVFSIAGLTPENPRIFISYRQKDTSQLAVQLFDALAHAGFDVFLDHFRIPPGVDFQARLTQELGDKAMLLLLESQNILASEWTRYEIDVAKTASLGILALRHPKGVDVDGIDPAVRMILNRNDFEPPGLDLLKADALDRVVERVRMEHSRALIRRRQILRDSLEGALLLEGVPPQTVSPGGIVVTGGQGRRYLVWLTPRAPELHDFCGVHAHVDPTSSGVVIGLARLMEPVRASQTEWLAGLASIHLFDEGLLKRAAAEMARGTL
ncbi:MAG: hypothetical protein DIJKHBIC_03362 [Thermoanaerobaculia bacterium]|nr:hypothetical protein [Thermoanaerobaculia bacterium]